MAWLGRKITWGFAPGGFDAWQAQSIDAAIDLLVDPDANGVEPLADPFEGIEYDRDNAGRSLAEGIGNWLNEARRGRRPLEVFMQFFWADYFAVSARSVRPPTIMFDHMRLLHRHGLGNFRDLLHEVTIDAAMLQFLDGALSTAGNPNENYGRELLELYSVGVDNFTEDDVVAAATALTGWVVRRVDPVPRYVPFRHDDTPQTLLGVNGVNDVATVVDAIVTNRATHERVVAKLATAVLGPDHDPALTLPIIDRFGEDLELRPVLRSLLELGVDGAATPSLVEPIPWLVSALRFSGRLPRTGELRGYFRTAGQIPLMPPNVGGYPDPDAYLSTSATIARFNMGASLAMNASQQALEASDDVDGLAWTLGMVEGFTPATRDAISGLPAGPDRIAAALASPDFLVV